MAKANSGASYKIGDVTQRLGISADTLRYYEKISLLPRIYRSDSGIRAYRENDLSRLRFIQRAKSMNFSLQEIGQLLEMREDPQHAREDIRKLTHRKLNEVEDQMKQLGTLRQELMLLINLCRGVEAGCPIIDDLESQA